MRAVQISEFGGPEVLHVVEVDEPVPQPGEVLIEVAAAGVNYADTHQADDTYLAPQHLPLVPGTEVTGQILTGDRAGQRVVALLTSGGYAERAVAVPALVQPIDPELTDAQALALLVQGTTAWYLLRSTARMNPGDTVVVHSAAGGVGSIAVQLARAWGAGRIIATASGDRRRELAESLGADVAIDISAASGADEVTEAIRTANGGHGVDVVLEMCGGHVFEGSLAALRPLGRLAVFGMASRTPPPPIDPAALMASSRTVGGFWLKHAVQRPDGLSGPLEELTSMVRAGLLTPVTGDGYPLDEAARAHQDLLSRTSVGKLVLSVGGGAGGGDAGATETAQWPVELDGVDLTSLSPDVGIPPIAGVGAPTQIGFPG